MGFFKRKRKPSTELRDILTRIVGRSKMRRGLLGCAIEFDARAAECRRNAHALGEHDEADFRMLAQLIGRTMSDPSSAELDLDLPGGGVSLP
jgi:hypothetical protein